MAVTAHRPRAGEAGCWSDLTRQAGRGQTRQGRQAGIPPSRSQQQAGRKEGSERESETEAPAGLLHPACSVHPVPPTGPKQHLLSTRTHLGKTSTHLGTTGTDLGRTSTHHLGTIPTTHLGQSCRWRPAGGAPPPARTAPHPSCWLHRQRRRLGVPAAPPAVPPAPGTAAPTSQCPRCGGGGGRGGVHVPGFKSTAAMPVKACCLCWRQQHKPLCRPSGGDRGFETSAPHQHHITRAAAAP